MGTSTSNFSTFKDNSSSVDLRHLSSSPPLTTASSSSWRKAETKEKRTTEAAMKRISRWAKNKCCIRHKRRSDRVCVFCLLCLTCARSSSLNGRARSRRDADERSTLALLIRCAHSFPLSDDGNKEKKGSRWSVRVGGDGEMDWRCFSCFPSHPILSPANDAEWGFRRFSLEWKSSRQAQQMKKRHFRQIEWMH